MIPGTRVPARMTATLTGLLLALVMAGVASADSTTVLATVEGRILDATPERVLYLTGAKQLLIRDVASGEDTAVPVRDGRTASGDAGRLIDGGALFTTNLAGGNVTSAELDEWRAGTTTALGPINSASSIPVAGDFAIWSASTTLIRREISTGTNVTVSTVAGNVNNDVAANGDVVFWDTSYRVQRWRNGVTTLISTAASPQWATYPLTDGATVVFRRHSSCCGSESGTVAFGSGGAESTLEGSGQPEWPDPGGRYRITAGWMAFTRPDLTLDRRVWTRDPSGAYAPAGTSQEGSFGDLLGLAPDGHVMYSVLAPSLRAYLAAVGARPFRLAFTAELSVSKAFWAGGRWYLVTRDANDATGTLQRVELDTAVTTPPPPVTQNDAVSFGLASTAAAAAIDCRLDDAGWAPCGTQRDYSGLAEGVHVFQARATDTATAAVDATPATATWRIDQTPPAPFAPAGPAEGSTVYLPAEPVLQWEAATDAGSGVTGYRLQLDGVPHALEAEQTTFTPSPALGAGQHAWSVEAVDAAGNVRTGGSRSFTVASDESPPGPGKLVAPLDAAVTTDLTPTLTWEPATDAESGVASQTVIIDGAQVQTVGPLVSTFTTALEEGPHTWSIRATDASGNLADSATRAFRVDSTDPVPALAITTDPLLAKYPVSFDAGASSDQHSTVVRYEWDLDADGSFETDTGAKATTTHTYSTPGLRYVSLRVTDAAGHTAAISTPVDVKAAPGPAPRLAVSPTPALTGQPVNFDAGASTGQHSAIARYEWDLDGDGSLETDTGATATATRTYDAPGARNVALRVTDAVGDVASTTAHVDVRVAPPPGPAGVSINAGARFTNDPTVTITTRWPPFASAILVANDGGFFGAVEQPLAPTVEWTLDESGLERLPKTVYVRFPGGLSPDLTFQDDIILDQTAPSIARATATRSRAGTYQVRLRATDAASGLATAQVARDRGRPSRAVHWRRSLRVRGKAAPRWVRAVDRAGNRSRWRRIAFRR